MINSHARHQTRIDRGRWRPARLWFLCALAPCILLGEAASLEIQVADEFVRSGGVAQIEVRAAEPRLISKGSLSIELNPAVFAEIADVAVFSSAGDAIGVARVTGLRVEVWFESPTGGVGRLPDLPILTIAARVLSDLPLDATATVAPDLSDAVWEDPLGSVYVVDAAPGTVTTGAALSIDNVTPGGALVPAGGVITIEGARTSTSRKSGLGKRPNS